MSVFWAGSNPQRHLWPGPGLTPGYRVIPSDASDWPSDRHGSLCCVQRILQESRKEPLALPLRALGQTSPSEGAEGNSCIWNQPILGVFRLSNVGGQPGGAAPDRGCHRAVSLTLGINFCVLVEEPAEPSPGPPTTPMDHAHTGAPVFSQSRAPFLLDPRLGRCSSPDTLPPFRDGQFIFHLLFITATCSC